MFSIFQEGLFLLFCLRLGLLGGFYCRGAGQPPPYGGSLPRERNKQTNKQTDRQTDKQTNKQRDRQTDRQTNTNKQTNKQINKQAKHRIRLV